MDKTIFTLNHQKATCDCIICRKKGVKSSDEHIIPKSLGGLLHTWDVCKDCNSQFGRLVDEKLINHIFSRFERYAFKLKGESGKKPTNPLTGRRKADDGNVYDVYEKEDGSLGLRSLPKFHLDKENNNLHVTLDAADIDEAQNIISNYAKRKSIKLMPGTEVRSDVHSSPAPAFNIEFTVDLEEFTIGMAKIAYEFALSIFPELINDPVAQEIADILHTGDVTRLMELVQIGDGFKQILCQIFGQLVDFDNKHRHYIMLVSLEGCLYCVVELFGKFSYGVKLSNKPHFPDAFPILCINDYENKDFQLMHLGELIEETHRFSHLGIKVGNDDQMVVDNLLQDNAQLQVCWNGNILPLSHLMQLWPDEKVVISSDYSRTVYLINGEAALCVDSETIPINEVHSYAITQKI